MHPFRSSLIILAATGIGAMLFKSGRARGLNSGLRHTETTMRNRQIADLCSIANIDPDARVYANGSRSLVEHLAPLSDYQVEQVYLTVGNLTRRLARLAGDEDPASLHRLLLDQQIHSIADLEHARAHGLIVHLGAHRLEAAFHDAADSVPGSGIPIEQGLGKPKDDLLQTVQGHGDAVAVAGKLLALRARIARFIHPQFSIGDRTADGEAPRRDSQEHGGAAPSRVSARAA